MYRRGLLVAALLMAAIPLLTGCVSGQGNRSEPTPGPTVPISEALRFDAEEYAERMGVSVEEAIRRLSLQDPIGDLNAELQQQEAATFAGLWIRHEPEYRVVVAFTRDGKKTLRPYVEGTPLADIIELRKGQFSLVELEAMQAEAMRELDKLDFDVHVSLSLENNRVEVNVSDRAWVESELQRVGADLPEGAELVVVEGGSTAQGKDRLLTPPVPGIAFPRQKPAEGYRESMMALSTGRLVLEGECLRLEGGTLPIWPPEFTLRAEGEQVLVIDGGGGVAARVGEEACLSGGNSGTTDEWVLQQIPAACRGEYWIVGSARPNLLYDSDLFSPEVVSTPQQRTIFLRYRPALSEQASTTKEVSGRLVLYDYQRCLQLDTSGLGGPVNLFWPSDWSLSASDGDVAVVDGTGQAVARVGDDVSLRVREIPQDWDLAVYRQLVNELPCNCMGGLSWLVERAE